MPSHFPHGVPLMVTKLLVSRRHIIVPKKPSYVALDMAFDGASNSYLFDKSRYRSHGTITGASWATGLHGKALDFDPTIPSYVKIPAAATQLNFTSENFSFIFRLKPDAVANFTSLYNRGLGNVDGFRIVNQGLGVIRLQTWQLGAQQRTISSAAALVIGEWATIGISRSGSSVTIYKNGVDVTSTADTHINPTTCAREALVGVDPNYTSNPVDGKIEFFRIFKGIALSASEHLAYHNALA